MEVRMLGMVRAIQLAVVMVTVHRNTVTMVTATTVMPMVIATVEAMAESRNTMQVTMTTDAIVMHNTVVTMDTSNSHMDMRRVTNLVITDEHVKYIWLTFLLHVRYM